MSALNWELERVELMQNVLIHLARLLAGTVQLLQVANQSIKHVRDTTTNVFNCRCSAGFRLDPKSLACVDIDECQESNGECSPLATCENQPGGFICRCMDGFYGNGIICQIDTSNTPAERIGKSSLIANWR